MRKVILFIICCQTYPTIVFSQPVVSPISYPVQGQVYTQSFDGLPATGTFAITGKGPFNLENAPFSIPGLHGWQFFMTGGSGNNATFLVSTGSSTSNGVQSLGGAGSTDRALGSVSTSSGIYSLGLLLTNNTGITLNSITLGFTAEQWRKGGSGNMNTWLFRYRTGTLTGIDAPDMIDEPHLNFGSVITTTGASSLNGNLPENRQVISYILIGITWKPGEQLLLRWDDADETGSDDACAIDDLHFSAAQVEDIPSVINKPVTINTEQAIQLNALVNDNNAPTNIIVEYDTVNTFVSVGLLLPQPDHIDPGSGTTTVTVVVGTVSPGTTYYYRLKATNRNGTATGATGNFTGPVNIDRSPPTIKKVIIADRVYKAGDTLLITARFSEKIYVGGSPSLKLTIGNTARQALYMNGSGTDSILFAYIIQSTDEDSSGSRLATTITITNSSIRDEAGNNSSLLLPAYQGNAIRIDGVAPKMSSLIVPPPKYYKEGDSLVFIVNFSEKVLINSLDTITLRITIGSSAKNIRLSGVDTQSLRFSYTVQKNDLDKTGISLGVLTTSSANTITDIAGNLCSLTIRNAGSVSNVKVDAVSPAFLVPGNAYLFACRNDPVIAISDALIAYDEEKTDTVTWTVTPLRVTGVVIQNAMTIISNGSKLSPGKIYYDLTAMKNDTDTLVATVSDGINETKKMIITSIQPGIRSNHVLSSQYVCSGSTANITGTFPAGGNGQYEYLWEYSTDSLNFSKVNGINSQKDIGSSQKLSLISWFRRKVISGSCIDTSSPVKIVPLKTGLWLGSFTNEWQNINNWCSAILPGSATDVFIPGNMASSPVITDTASCHDLTIAGNGSLTVKGSLQITGDVLAGSSMLDITKGKLIAAGNTPQTIAAGILKDRTIRDLSVNNIAGLFLPDTLYLDGSLQLISGYLQTNDRLLIRHTGNIGASAEGTLINGNVSIDHLIPGGKRGFRLFGHPLSSGIGLQMIKDSIDITGSRGSEHGFSSTSTNNPSAFWYNTLSTKDTFSIDDNWTAFSSTNGEGENAWKKNQGIRLLMRGRPGEGLDGKPTGDGNNNTYLPGAVILKFTGAVNTGDQEVLLLRSDSAGYNLIANPYASPIDLSMLSYGRGVSDHYWIWDPNQGIAGGYSAVPFQTSFILPAFGAFFVKATGSLDNSIVFTEHCKVQSTGSLKLPVISNFPDHHVELRLFSDSIFMDRVFLYHSDSAKIGVDKFDAEKLMNSGVNFYSLSREKKMLSIDARPLSNASFINLGLQTEKPGIFSLVIADSKLSSESTLLLHDKYLDQWMKLEKDSSYLFFVTTDTASAGNYRFEIAAKPEPVDTILSSKKIISMIGPVPAFNEITIFYSIDEKEATSLYIRDRYGILIKTMPIDPQKNGQVTIQINDLLPGIYFIQIRAGKYADSKKIIKL